MNKWSNYVKLGEESDDTSISLIFPTHHIYISPLPAYETDNKWLYINNLGESL